MAADYYHDSQVCLLYHEACTVPLATADGASSYRVKRSAVWLEISDSAACEGMVTPMKVRTGISTSSECRAFCENLAGCIAIDHYNETGYCNMFTEACSTPIRIGDGAQSFRMSRPTMWAQ